MIRLARASDSALASMALGSGPPAEVRNRAIGGSMFRVWGGIVSLVWFGSIARADTTPPQLLNKSIVFSWTVQNTLRESRTGTVTSAQGHAKITIYVSRQGRIFERIERSGDKGSKNLDIDPTTKRNSDLGEDTDRHFEGNDLIVIRSLPSGASRTVISFDPSFSTCTVKFHMGRANGARIARKGLDGRTYEILSGTTVGLTCSVREGNLFAS